MDVSDHGPVISVARRLEKSEMKRMRKGKQEQVQDERVPMVHRNTTNEGIN